VAAARERCTAGAGGWRLDRPARLTGPGGQAVTLRRLLFGLLQKYARHTGHADLLREAVDGVVGEDPPAGWQPRS
jgi:Protein of unknown function (DUF664)